jgi:glucose/mannose-6-phosphate isomerase
MMPELDLALLDDVEALERADPAGMLRAVASSGAQVREAATYVAEAGVESLSQERPRAVILSAVGSSAASCEVLRALLADDAPIPLVEAGGPTLPRWVGPLDLVIAVSRSGTARPTLDAVTEAGRRGCRVVTVSAPGSPLAVLSDRVRGLQLPTDKAPRHTRASLWSLAVPLIAIADALGIAAVPPSDLALAADRLDSVAEHCRPSSDAFVNPAKRLATELAAAKRFARQLHSNAKYPALDGGLQEASHGTVALFDGPFAGGNDDVFADPFEDPIAESVRLRVVLMRDAGETEADSFLRHAAADLAAERGVRASAIEAEEGRPIERLAQLIALGDFASVYLGLGLHLDPSPTRAVLEMKERIEGRQRNFGRAG